MTIVTASFMKTLANKIREVAIDELFDGIDNREAMHQRLALDYTVPITWAIEDQEYPMQVVAYITYLDPADSLYKQKPVAAAGKFQGQNICTGPANWPSVAEQFAYQLVRKLRAEIAIHSNVKMQRLGTRTGMKPHMKRLVIE